MPATRKKPNVRKPRASKARSGRKTGTRPVSNRKQPSVKRAGAKTAHHKTVNEATYVFECTRPGCGYRIWRDDKSEEGQHRYDLKCPKCHNKEFKCLGKGDLPETFEATIPAAPLDFGNINPVDLGTN